MNKKPKATWIWYPGDFEMWQHMKISLRRKERLTTFPAFWRIDTFYPSVIFRKTISIDKPEKIKVYADGDFHIALNNRRLRYARDVVKMPAGRHILSIAVCNQHSVPAVFVQGETVFTDESWEVSCYDGVWKKAGLWNLDDPYVPPSKFSLPVKEIYPANVYNRPSSYFVDFGKEVYAALKLIDVSGTGSISCYYGESVDEAMSRDHCVLIDLCEVTGERNQYTFDFKAYRYVNVVYDGNVKIGKFSALFEYLPVEYRGAFKSSDEKLNLIWDVSRYTLHLNTREFFLDGIKRDGWVWSGDAYQSSLMNYYSFFDKEVCKRTFIALRGKDPVPCHINTIMDYTFYWFIGLYDYYLYTGDLDFIGQIYPQMLTLMDFCLKRTNKNGMMEGLEGDWIFIDWASMSKKGEVSAEQLLFCKSIEIMELFSGLLNDTENTEKFASLARNLRSKIVDCFWNEDLGGLVTTRIDGKPLEQITKHANIFAYLFGFLDDKQTESVINRVLLNDKIQKIKTPYFRFYELSALCEAGKHDFVIKEMLDYWGGMIDLGATTFWEEYDPTVSGSKLYAMYGEPFDKSLCHAWGASPIYLLGKYFLGVRPLTPGYETYEVKPNLGSLSWIQGSVPTPEGDINVYMDREVIKVCSAANPASTGFLRFYSSMVPKADTGEIRTVSENFYEITLDMANHEYVVHYKPLEC